MLDKLDRASGAISVMERLEESGVSADDSSIATAVIELAHGRDLAQGSNGGRRGD